jgi:hypothetical protein
MRKLHNEIPWFSTLRCESRLESRRTCSSWLLSYVKGFCLIRTFRDFCLMSKASVLYGHLVTSVLYQRLLSYTDIWWLLSYVKGFCLIRTFGDFCRMSKASVLYGHLVTSVVCQRLLSYTDIWWLRSYVKGFCLIRTFGDFCRMLKASVLYGHLVTSVVCQRLLSYTTIKVSSAIREILGSYNWIVSRLQSSGMWRRVLL